jgi:hypothetical protein
MSSAANSARIHLVESEAGWQALADDISGKLRAAEPTMRVSFDALFQPLPPDRPRAWSYALRASLGALVLAIVLTVVLLLTRSHPALLRPPAAAAIVVPVAPAAVPRPTVAPKRKVASAARKTAAAPQKRKKKLAAPVRLMAPNKLAASGKRLKH